MEQMKMGIKGLLAAAVETSSTPVFRLQGSPGFKWSSMPTWTTATEGSLTWTSTVLPPEYSLLYEKCTPRAFFRCFDRLVLLVRCKLTFKSIFLLV